LLCKQCNMFFHLCSWTPYQNISLPWLLNNMSKYIIASVIYSTTTADIWNDFQEHFRQRNGSTEFYSREISTKQNGQLFQIKATQLIIYNMIHIL
jgi:predicted PolB exonuclease-like 3'-5' exonuclease